MKKTKKRIDLLREYVKWRCEGCRMHENDVGKLQPHRIKRGWQNGDYHFRNIKLLCKNCHRKLHQNEFIVSQAKS